MNDIRSIGRALLVLRVMNERPIWSLQELQEHTGLPKSTLHRILSTLRAERYVRSDEGMYGAYQLTSNVHELSRGVTEKSHLIDIAAPILIKKTKEIKWPLSLAVVQGHQMRVVVCTMPYSPYAIRPSSYGRLYNLFDSALGQAYFAFCSKDERRILYDLYKLYSEPTATHPSWSQLRALVSKTRTRGYGIRVGPSVADSSAFAVPVYHNGDLTATVCYSAFSGSLNSDLLQRFLPILSEVSESIGVSLSRKRARHPSEA